MAQFPDAGKITADFFAEVIYPRCGAQRDEVLAGPEYGVDVAVVRLGNGQAMAVTTDPLSLIPSMGLKESAWLSVHLMASDITTTGCPPQYAMFDLTLPPDLSAEDFDVYWGHISDFCSELGTAIIGGHTGRFEGQQSTVVGGGMMMTVAPEDEILTSKDGNPGDTVLVTRECALVSTAVLALSFPETIRNACGADILQQGQDLFYTTSTVSSALAAVTAGKGRDGVTAMHDVTEGGVCGALVELATASGCGIRIDKSKVPVGQAQEKICGRFGLDPFVCIGAGSLILTVHPSKVDGVTAALKAEGIPAAAVGNLTEQSEGMTLLEDGGETPLQHPGVDPYWQAFFQAFQAGWK